MQAFKLSYINGSYTCFVFPKETLPNGLYLTYESCPENFSNKPSILVNYCCMRLIIQSIQNSYYKKTQDWILHNSSTLLLLPALFFNILSLAVLNRFQRNTRNNHRTSTTFYMKCICIFDTLTIIAKFLNEQIVVGNGLRQTQIILTSSICKSLPFLESVFAIVSIYLLIAMTFDKLVCVVAPLKVNQILTNRHARYTFAFILIFAVALSSFYLFDRRVYILDSSSNEPDDLRLDDARFNFSNSSLNISNSTSPYKKIIYDCDSIYPERYQDWVIVENLIRVFMPILSLSICNVWIVIALRKAKRHTDALFSHSHNPPPIIITDSTDANISYDEKLNQPSLNRASQEKNHVSRNQNRSRSNSKFSLEGDFQLKPIILNKRNSDEDSNLSRKFTLRAHRGGGGNGVKGQSHNHNRANNQHISIMLFTVSIGFILLNLPFAIRIIIDRQFRDKSNALVNLYQTDNIFETSTSKSALREAAIYEFFSTLTFLLQDLNYISNFFFYFISGSRFRERLVSMLKCENANKLNKTSRQSSVYRKNFTRKDSGLSQINVNNQTTELSLRSTLNLSKANKNTKSFYD